MASKRANGEGCIRQRKDGTWEAEETKASYVICPCKHGKMLAFVQFSD